MAKSREEREHERYTGGSQYVHEEPGDRPGRARGPGLALIVVLGFLVLAIPIAWGLGALATVGAVVGDAVLVGLWLVWGLMVLIFAWSVWSLWRSAA